MDKKLELNIDVGIVDVYEKRKIEIAIEDFKDKEVEVNTTFPFIWLKSTGTLILFVVHKDRVNTFDDVVSISSSTGEKRLINIKGNYGS